MGQRTAYIIQRIYHIKDYKNDSKKQIGGYVIGATIGFYCQDGYGVYLLRDVNSLLQRVRVRERLLDLGDYTWMGSQDTIVKEEYYRFRGQDFIEAPEERAVIHKSKYGIDIEKTVSTKEIKEKLLRLYNSYDEFREAMDPVASYPIITKLDVWVSKRIKNIDTKNLFKHIPMKDFRDEKTCKDYFECFDNNDGGALITLYGGEDYSSDINEVRIIDGRDKYGQFVTPDYYIQQYIDMENEYAKSSGKKSSANWLKKNWKNFISLIEDFQKARIIKEF